MKVVLTGSSGRVGRAIFGALTVDHNVVGIDRIPFGTSRITGDFTDRALLERAMEGADAVIHTAALHAPHVGICAESEFYRINVEGTRLLFEIAKDSGAKRMVLTSTTALYGGAIAEGRCTWVDEQTLPEPASIYHRTKAEAETTLEELANEQLSVRVMRMSRCFPETADLMAAYRLHRGIDARDVADAHVAALTNDGAPFERYVVSGATPFARSDCDALASDADVVLRERVPGLAQIFQSRGWLLPRSIDRVYAPTRAEHALGWKARYGFHEVVAQVDRRSLEVLPVGASIVQRFE